MDFVKLESEIRTRYTIPSYLSFSYSDKSSIDSPCPLCSNSDIFSFITPFVEATVDYDKIIELVRLKFNLLVNKDIIDNHRSHYKASFIRRDSLVQRQLDEVNIINSSINSRVDTNIVIDNAISGLHARMLEHSACGDFQSKEYIETSKSLLNWVALKKKVDGELSGASGLDLTDVIRIKGKEANGEKDGNTDVELAQHVIRTETRTRAVIKTDGDKQHSRPSRIDIPCER